MTVVRCFLLEPTDRARLLLRRYGRSDAPCTAHHGMGYCNAYTGIGEASLELVEQHPDEFVFGEMNRRDPRWPTVCEACGQPFDEGDHWQRTWDVLYRRTDTCEAVTIRTAPPGAMWYADWMGDHNRGPDGRCLVVKTPGGEWMIDGPAFDAHGRVTNPRGWTRTGAPPRVTVSPSILMHRDGYHAYLIDGDLRPC